jgi:hypothetical protein
VLWVKPDQIITQKNDVMVPKSGRFFCYVIDGDWDLMEKRLEDHPIFGMLKEHFQYRVRWSDTSFYPEILFNIRERGVYWNGCRSEIDVQARCAYLDKLFDEMKNTGYTIPDGLKYGETGLARTCTPQEIIVNVGRNGRLIYENGKHRLFIAKILGLPLVPVRIMVRHKLWQDYRDQIVLERRKKRRSEYAQSIISHPDIDYLNS